MKVWKLKHKFDLESHQMPAVKVYQGRRSNSSLACHYYCYVQIILSLATVSVFRVGCSSLICIPVIWNRSLSCFVYIFTLLGSFCVKRSLRFNSMQKNYLLGTWLFGWLKATAGIAGVVTLLKAKSQGCRQQQQNPANTVIRIRRISVHSYLYYAHTLMLFCVFSGGKSVM